MMDLSRIRLIFLLGFRKKCFPGKFKLAAFLVNGKELHFNLLSLLQYLFYFFKPAMFNLRNMEQPILTGEYFHKGPVRGNGFYFPFVYLSRFRNSNDALDPFHGRIYGCLVHCKHIHNPHITDLFNGDGTVGFRLNLLNHLTSRPNDRTDHIFGYFYPFDPRGMRFVIGIWCSDGFTHFVKDMQSADPGLFQRLGKDLVGESFHFNVHLSRCLSGAGTGAAVTAGAGGGSTGGRVAQANDVESAASAVRLAEQDYVSAVARYRELLATGGGEVNGADPVSRFAALEHLVMVSQAAVRQAPGDPFLNGFLASAMAERDAAARMVSAGRDNWF